MSVNPSFSPSFPGTTFWLHGDESRQSCVATNGQQVVCGTTDDDGSGRVHIWSLEDPSVEGVDGYLPGMVTEVAVSRVAPVCAAACWDSAVFLMDLRNGLVTGTLEASGRSAVFSADGSLLATHAKPATNRVDVWDVRAVGQAAHVHTLPIPGIPIGCDVAFGQDRVAFGTWGRPSTEVRIFSLKNPAQPETTWVLEGQIGAPVVAVTPDDRYVLAGSGQVVRIWDTTLGSELGSIRQYGRVRALAVTDDGYAVAGSDDRRVNVWSVRSGRNIRCIETSGIVRSLAVSPNGTLVCSFAGNREIQCGNIGPAGLVEEALDIENTIDVLRTAQQIPGPSSLPLLMAEQVIYEDTRLKLRSAMAGRDLSRR